MQSADAAADFEQAGVRRLGAKIVKNTKGEGVEAEGTVEVGLKAGARSGKGGALDGGEAARGSSGEGVL